MSITGLKLRGSMMTWPMSGTFWAAIFFQKSALGSSGIASDTEPTVTSVA